MTKLFLRLDFQFFLGKIFMIVIQLFSFISILKKRFFNVKAAAYFLALSASLISFPSQAQDKTDFLSFSIGYYDVFDDEEAVDFRLEYRPDHTYFWSVKPWAGVEFTSDASFWAGGGFLANIKIDDRLYLIPSIGAGLYTQGSSDLDLGHPLEFRTQLELAYEFEGSDRLGISLSHMSNASLDDHNPGVESVNLYYHIPFGHIGL